MVLPTFEAPEWVMKVLTFLVILGFPLATILAWAFELTPEGIKREETVDRAESIRHQTGRKLDFAIIGLQPPKKLVELRGIEPLTLRLPA